MQNNKERWMELCNQASMEQDPKKFAALIEEIIELLAKKKSRLDEKETEK